MPPVPTFERLINLDLHRGLSRNKSHDQGEEETRQRQGGSGRTGEYPMVRSKMSIAPQTHRPQSRGDRPPTRSKDRSAQEQRRARKSGAGKGVRNVSLKRYNSRGEGGHRFVPFLKLLCGMVCFKDTGPLPALPCCRKWLKSRESDGAIKSVLECTGKIIGERGGWLKSKSFARLLSTGTLSPIVSTRITHKGSRHADHR